MHVPPTARIVEVGPRDGLQNERALIATADKIAFVDHLSRAGHQVIEVSAFVSPKWVPQMADAADVFAAITRRPGAKYSALVPNQRGLARAIDAGVSQVAIFAAASETFSRRNINQSIDESLATYAAVCADAAAAGVPVRGYLSTCFVCPFEGPIDAQRVADISSRLLEIGVFEVAISDTIGAAHPGMVQHLLDLSARAFRSRKSRCTSTTLAAPRSPTFWRASITASRRSTVQPGASAAAPSRRALRATSQPRTCSSC